MGGCRKKKINPLHLKSAKSFASPLRMFGKKVQQWQLDSDWMSTNLNILIEWRATKDALQFQGERCFCRSERLNDPIRKKILPIKKYSPDSLKRQLKRGIERQTKLLRKS